MRNNHAAIFRRSLLLMFAAVLLSACLFGGCSTEDAAIVRQGMPLAELKEAADKILLDAPTCCIVQIGRYDRGRQHKRNNGRAFRPV